MSYLLNKLEQEYSHLLRDELEGASLLKRIQVLENKVEKLEKEIQQNNLFNVAHCSSAYASAFNSAAHTHYNPYSMGALQQAMGNAEYRQEKYKKQEALNLQKQEAWEIYKKRMKLHCDLLLNKLTPIYEKYSKEFNPDWKINVWHSWDKPPRFYVIFTGVYQFKVGEGGIYWNGYEFSPETKEILTATKFYEYLIDSAFLKEIKEVINYYPFEY